LGRECGVRDKGYQRSDISDQEPGRKRLPQR
jgi:hypothetical protein